jgi:hypothetical protein
MENARDAKLIFNNTTRRQRKNNFEQANYNLITAATKEGEDAQTSSAHKIPMIIMVVVVGGYKLISHENKYFPHCC